MRNAVVWIALLAVVAVADERPTIPAGKTWAGKVVGVTDGDTLTLLVDQAQYKIRLAGIDAPESGQAFGTQAKKALSERVFDQQVKVLSLGADRYDRTLGVVYAGDACVNTELVSAGFAWHYTTYSDSKVLANAETAARAAKAGLWTDPDPMPPWEWRRKPAEEKQAQADEKPSAETEAAPEADTEAESTPSPPAQSHWITSSSSVRHNSGCRYYRNSKGRPCGPNEGRACKICGG